MENNNCKTTLELGDVVLIAEGGWGLLPEDEGKYVEIVGVSDGGYLQVSPYESTLNYWPCGLSVDCKSFGDNPMVLFNVNDGDCLADTPIKEEYTGSSSSYYTVQVKHPTTSTEPYTVECNDIIEALDMDFAEGNAFKAIWRKAMARKGVKKKGYDNGVYDSEKVVFFGQRMLVKAKNE